MAAPLHRCIATAHGQPLGLTGALQRERGTVLFSSVSQRATNGRHVAVVFDADSNSVRGYLDGEKFAEQQLQDVQVSQMDCSATEDTYIPFGHLPPDGTEFVFDIQDLRMYTAPAAVGDDEIRAIAVNGVVKRTW